MAEQKNKLIWAERVARLMDEQFKVGKFRFGLDPILNIIPIAGDVAGFAVSAVLIATISRNGASGKVVTKMFINALLDATIGAIPILGFIFDFFYKANTRNIKLLREYYEQGKHQGSGKGTATIFIVIMIVIIGLVIWLSWLFVAWAYQELSVYF